jgi:hypothetical protein
MMDREESTSYYTPQISYFLQSQDTWFISNK